MLKMDLEYHQGILFVRLGGSLNEKSSFKINNYLNPVIEKHKIKYLIYNCYNLKNIDSYGADAIRSSKYLIKNNRGEVRACYLPNEVSKVFKNIKIKKIASELEAFSLLED